MGGEDDGESGIVAPDLREDRRGGTVPKNGVGSGKSGTSKFKNGDIHEARFLRSIKCQIMGVKMSCIASGILLPGQTIVLARDMNESGNIDRS